MIALIDYDAGNVRSVEKAFRFLGREAFLTRKKEEILQADAVVLPGVGSFGQAMKTLRDYDLPPVIREVVAAKKPFLGICLGLQLLFEGSDESPDVEGLSLLQGRCVRFKESADIKVPQMGWNALSYPKESVLFAGIPAGSEVYFVHSYHARVKDPAVVAAYCHHGSDVTAAVEKDNLFACQFHPEKSGKVGLQILKNFLAYADREETPC